MTFIKRPAVCILVLIVSVTGQCPDLYGCFPPGTDLAKNDTVTAMTVTSSCSLTSYKSFLLSDDTNYTCADGVNNATKLVDLSPGPPSPNFETHWQSVNTVNATSLDTAIEQVITFNFTHIFTFQEVQVSFIAPHTTPEQNVDGRPDAITIEYYNGTDWKPWRYFSVDCGTFPTGTFTTLNYGQTPAQLLDVYCQSFTRGDAQQNRLEVHPSLQFQDQFFSNKALHDFFSTTAVRVRLQKPRNMLSVGVEPERSYYAVTDIKLTGHCLCYGHSASCTGVNGAECECAHNTKGQHCEMCKDLYNNKMWKMGNHQESNACEVCNCNGLATSCEYYPSKGHGVCVGCAENSAGDFCDQCQRGYFVNPSKVPDSTVPAASPDANCTGHNGQGDVTYPCDSYCIPCNCTNEGTLQSSNYLCNTTSGQCTCKVNVQGRNCHECKDGFHSIDPANPDGCDACVCNSSGTIQNTDYCEKDNGQCRCRTNTEGARCDSCKPATYNFTADNIQDGCTPCACDVGGASTSDCHLVSGQCPCRPKITGRTCSQAEEGYYVPKLDHFTFEAETAELNGSNTLDEAGHGTLLTGRGFVELAPGGVISQQVVIPEGAGGLFDVIIRYKLLSTNPTTVDVKLTMVAGVEYTCQETMYGADHMWMESLTLTQSDPKGFTSMNAGACLNEQQGYSITVTAPNSNTNNVFIDSIVLLPQISTLTAFMNSSDDTRNNMTICRNASRGVDPMLRETHGCAPLEFSLMAELLKTAIPCNCVATGTTTGGTNTCESQGGQCPCKDSVILRDCALCKVDSYGGTDNSVCLACNCDPKGSMRASCDSTGKCECRTNVMGEKCDACEPEHFGLDSGMGCQSCTCSEDYAVDNQCTEEGVCTCKPGVGGNDCTQCLDMYFNLTTTGCQPCNCNEFGRKSNICNKTTGVCTCKNNAEGDKCDTCKTGYFGLGSWASAGCLPCYCSGHSTNCTTATGWFDTNTTSEWPVGAEGQEQWTGEDHRASEINLEFKLDFNVGNTIHVMRFMSTAQNQDLEHVYFVAPEKFLGNMQTAYGRSLTFVMKQSSVENPLSEYTEGDVLLKGKSQAYTLTTNLTNPIGTEKTINSVYLHESTFYVNQTDGDQATYEQMMQTLLYLESIRIRAKYSNTANAYVELHSVVLEHATTDQASAFPGGPINNVENCSCPALYQGLSCDLCADGNRRATSNSTVQSACESCNCNNHEGGPCNQETGVCTCKDNTQGKNCETCAPKYYGDATKGQPDDCKPCLCPGDVVAGDVNVFATSCTFNDTSNSHKCVDCAAGYTGDRCDTCADGYFGQPTNASINEGKCSQCICNGRADTCDKTTGVCINCSGNTQGQQCNECKPGYYGSPADCKPCSCNASDGKTGECDNQRGECTCKPNVMAPLCEACVPNAFNFSSGNGCSMCDCHQAGSTELSCDEDGQCQCRALVTGLKCDSCEVGYWQINTVNGCEECGCHVEGRDPSSNGTCNLTTGQCVCKSSAFIGRTCDMCASVTSGTYEHISLFSLGEFPNCQVCGECFDHWAEKLEALAIEIYTQFDEVDVIWGHYDRSQIDAVASMLDNIRNNIVLGEESIYKAGNFTQMLNSTKEQLRQIAYRTADHNTSIDALQGQHADAVNKTKVLQMFQGSAELSNGSTVSLTGLNTSVLGESSNIETQNTLALEVWGRVRDLSVLVSDTGDMSRDLKLRVNNAIAELVYVMNTHSLVLSLHEGTFLPSYRTNKDALSTADSVIQTAETRLTELIVALQVVTSQYDAANRAMQDVISSSRSDQIVALSVSSISVKQYADYVFLELNNAIQKVAVFLTIAREALDSLTTTLEDVSEGIQTLNEQTVKLGGLQDRIDRINAITLRTLAEMAQLTQIIQVLSVPQASIDAIQQRVTDAEALAQSAMTDTQKASDDAQLVTDEYQGILDALNEALTLRSETAALRTASDTKFGTANDILQQIRDNAQNISIFADNANVNIDDVSADLTVVSTCLNQRRTGAAATRTGAEAALMSAQEADGILQALTSITNSVGVSIGANQDITASLSSISNIEADLNATKESFDRVDLVSNLQEILQNYNTQSSEILQLENDINQLEQDLDDAIAQLNDKIQRKEDLICTVN